LSACHDEKNTLNLYSTKGFANGIRFFHTRKIPFYLFFDGGEEKNWKFFSSPPSKNR